MHEGDPSIPLSRAYLVRLAVAGRQAQEPHHPGGHARRSAPASLVVIGALPCRELTERSAVLTVW